MGNQKNANTNNKVTKNVNIKNETSEKKLKNIKKRN
jgi:hypothetical protein